MVLVDGHLGLGIDVFETDVVVHQELEARDPRQEQIDVAVTGNVWVSEKSGGVSGPVPATCTA